MARRKHTEARASGRAKARTSAPARPAAGAHADRRSSRSSSADDLAGSTLGHRFLGQFLSILLCMLLQGAHILIGAYVAWRYASPEALGAILGTAQIIGLALMLAMGLGTGCAVVVGQHIGAGDDRRLTLSVHTMVTLSLALGLFASVIGVLCAGPLLSALNVPASLMDGALAFMYVCAGSAFLPIAFNMNTALQRAVGEVRTPVLAAALACLVDAGLNLLLVMRLGMGVLGVALASAGAYLIGLTVVLRSLTQAAGARRLHLSRVRIYPPMAIGMLACALPLLIQTVLLPLSNRMTQTDLASFGSQTTLAWVLCARVGYVVWIVSDAFALAATTLAAQTFGAGDYRYLSRTLHVSLPLTFAGMAGVETLVCWHAHRIAALLTADTAIIELTAWLVLLTIPFYVILALVGLLAGVIRGTGDSMRPTVIIALCTFVIRAAMRLLVLPHRHSLLVVVATHPLAWMCMAIMLVVYYRYGRWLERRITRSAHGHIRHRRSAKHLHA